MEPAKNHGSSAAVELVKALGKGKKLPGEVGESLRRLFGVPVGLDGLSRLYQPGFPGIRVFAVMARLAPDQALEITLVGIARDGTPVWTGERAFVKGRDGSLEIQHGVNEVEAEYRSRNIVVDLIQREIDILSFVDPVPSARITIDAEGVGCYICALHGFAFADETEAGPPVRSRRALDPAGDRRRLIAAAPPVVERAAARLGLGRIAVEAALHAFARATSPWELARVQFAGVARPLAEGDDGEMGVGALGRELLLSREAPPWRAALALGQDDEARQLGAEYRRRKTHRSEARLAQEIQGAMDQLHNSAKRDGKARALRTLGLIAPPWLAAELRPLTEGRDRRVAALARHTIRQMSGQDLPDRLLEYADDPRHDARKRGLAYRVLAEHFRPRLLPRVAMLRVNPDARIQRAVVPLLADEPEEAGPALASLLAANPAAERERQGLFALRQELIEELARIADSRTLPALIDAFRSAPPPEESFALQRALIAFPDPRAQVALSEGHRRLEPPAIP